MKKNTILKIINPTMGLLLLNQILTGFFGQQLPHKTFEILHKKSAIVIGCLVVAHIILNWSWVKANYLKILFMDKSQS